MSDRDLSLLIHTRQERALVVDSEVEDAVLIRCAEGGLEDGGVVGGLHGFEGDAVEGGEHAEFELERVGGGDGEGCVVVEFVF